MLPPPKKYEGDYNRVFFVKVLRRCWINDRFSVAEEVMAMMAQDGTCLISRSSRKENYGVVMEKSDNYFQGKRYVAALIAAMTLLSGAGFTVSVASSDTDTVGYETDRIAFSGARTVCGECSIDFAALTRSRMFLIDGGGRRGTEGA